MCKCFGFHLAQVHGLSTRKGLDFYLFFNAQVILYRYSRHAQRFFFWNSHAHASFGYFSVFYRAHNSCPRWACIDNLYWAGTVWHTAGPIRVAVTGPKLLQILTESDGGQNWPSAYIPRWSHYAFDPGPIHICPHWANKSCH